MPRSTKRRKHEGGRTRGRESIRGEKEKGEGKKKRRDREQP